MATHALVRLRLGPLARPVARLLLGPDVWLRRSTLDARLAQGVAVDGDVALARRARQLRSRDMRRRTADALARAIAAAGTGPGLTARVPVSARAVEEARAELELLMARLDADEPVRAQGVASARRIVTDPGSPLYAPIDPAALRRAAEHALGAL